MLGTDATITSADPHTGQQVRVTITNGAATYQPAEAVIVYAATGATGRSVDTCCSTINFFTNASRPRRGSPLIPVWPPPSSTRTRPSR
ncbi:organomercurial lyase [Micromonospora sp. 4G55]